MALNIKSVGVIGAGQMGNGIAHVCALAGYAVLLDDVNGRAHQGRHGDHQRNMTRQVGAQAISEDRRKRRARAASSRRKNTTTWRTATW